MKKSIFSALCLVLLATTTQSAWGATNGDVFKRIDSASELSDGDEIIFVNQAETYACGTTQNKNNRTPVSITTSNNAYTYTSSDNVQVFVVKVNGSNFGFHTGSGYIYSASSSSNNLRTNTTAASTLPTTTSAWTISVSNYVFTIQNVSNKSYYLAFNSTTYFSQYKSGQSKPYIYKKSGSTPTTLSFEPNEGTVSPTSTTTSPATLPTPTKDGYNFLGWCENKDLSDASPLAAGTSYSFTTSKTLYAKWELQPTCTSITPTITYSSYSVVVGSTIAAPTIDGNTGSGAVTYTSSNTAVATVDANGVVTGVASGTCTITATVAASGDYCAGTVTSSAITVTEKTYTLTYSMGSTTGTKTVAKGTKILDALKGITPTSCDATSTTFMGWTASPISGKQNDAPTFISDTETMPAEAKKVYAVFAKAETTTGGGSSNQTYNFADMDNFAKWGTGYSKQTTTFPDGAYVELASANRQTQTITDCPVSKGGDVIFKAPTGSTISALTFTCKQWGTKAQTITLHTSTDGTNYSETTVKSSNFTLTTNNLSNVVAVKFTFSADEQVGYESLAVTYGGGSTTTYSDYVTQCGECTANTLSLTATETTVNLPETGGVDVNIASFVTIGNNNTAVTYSGDGVNSSTGAFHADAKGDYVINISQPLGTGNPVICDVSKTFTVHVKATPTLELIVSTPLEKFEATCMEPSAKQQITVHGFNLEDKITASLGSGSAFQLSTTGGDTDAEWSTSVDFAKDDNNRVDNKPLYIRLKSNLTGCPSSATVDREGTIKASSTNATQATQSVSGKISSPVVTVKLNDQGNNYNITGKRLCCTIAEDEVKGANTHGFSTTPCEGALFSHFTLDPNDLEGKVTFPYSITSTDALTFYAVYKKSEDGGAVGGDYELVTATQDDWSGEYLIVSDSRALNGSLTTLDANNNYFDVTVTDNKIASTAEIDAKNVTIAKNGTNVYSIKTASGYYIGSNTTTSNTLSSTTTAPTSSTQASAYNHTISINNNNVTLKPSGKSLGFNAANDQLRFRYNGGTITLYKKNESFTYDLTPCGPVIKGTNNIKVTSVNGAWVRSLTDIAITGERLPSNVTIKARVLSGNFKLREPAISSTGSTEIILATNYTNATYNGTLALLYTPTAAGETSDGKIELRVYTTGGNIEHAKCTLTVQGHALPEKFVIAANTGSGWVALPNDKGATLETAGTNTAYPISVDNDGDPTKATRAPSSTVYAGTGRASTYAYSSQSGVRFTYGGKYLEGSLAADTKLCLSPNHSEHAQSWYLESDNFKDYNAYLGARTNPNRHLAYDAMQQAIANYAAEGTVRFLPIDAECRYFPAPKVTVSTTKSTEVTLTFDALAGATGYKISTDGTTWNDASYTIADGVVTLTISGLDANTDYTYYVRGIDSGSTLADCAESAQVEFHTTNCDDVPYDISYTSDANSITLTWKMTSATATVRLYSDDAGKTQVGSDSTGVTSPCTIPNLDKATTYYARILADGTCPSELIEVSTERPQLDVVEWYENKIDVEINTDEKISVLLENQVTKGTGSGKVAKDLFFSKYFEGSGSLKLLGIFNGTNADINLADYTLLKGQDGDGTNGTEFDLSQLGTIKQGQEIILFAEPVSTESPYKCSEKFLADKKTKYGENENPRWILCDNESHNNITFPQLNFSGDDPLILRKNGVAIDVFGVSTKTTAPNKIEICSGRSDKCWVADNVPNMDYGKTAKDFGGTIPDGVNIDDKYITAYTARIIMFRSNLVESGADAVAKNTSTFATFSTEWQVRQVCRSGDDGDLTCAAYTELGVFDYSGYYTTYDSLMVKEFDETGRNPDGTITIEIPRLDTLSCRGLKIIASDESGHVLTTKEYRVPIIVYKSTTTADAKVFHFSEDTCKTCDVVVRPNIKLQAKAQSDGGKVEFRNMMVYAKGNFEIPTGVDFMLDNLEMHAKNDTVAYALIDGRLTVSNKITHVKRINSVTMGGAGYHFALPYPCDGTSIRQYNGNSLGEYDVDWVVFYYDGAARAETGTWNEAGTGYNGKSYWRTFPTADFELQPNVAYIIATAGINAGNSLKSVYFPPKASEGYSDITYYTESTPEFKTVTVQAYTGTAAAKHANDRGWNFIGHPYISMFNHQTTGATGTNNDQVKMGYWEGTEYSETGKVYVNVPQNGVTSYEQDEAANLKMSPFLGYFVQVAGDADAELTFIKNARKLITSAPMMRTTSVRDEHAEVALKLTAPSGEFDRTTILVDEAYTVDYEINRDLGKMARAKGLPRFYSISMEGLNEKMCYQALPSAVAENNVPLGFYAYEAGTYTIAIDSTRGDLSAVTAVALKVDGNVVHDLLSGPYTFAVSKARSTDNDSFSVSIQRKAQVTTDVNVVGNSDAVAPVVYTQGHRFLIQQLPLTGRLHIIDAVGRTIVDEQLDGCSERQYTLATDGVYVVRVATDSNVFIVKVAIR